MPHPVYGLGYTRHVSYAGVFVRKGSGSDPRKARTASGSQRESLDACQYCHVQYSPRVPIVVYECCIDRFGIHQLGNNIETTRDACTANTSIAGSHKQRFATRFQQPTRNGFPVIFGCFYSWHCGCSGSPHQQQWWKEYDNVGNMTGEMKNRYDDHSTIRDHNYFYENDNENTIEINTTDTSSLT